ncbi:WD repeat-containing protein 76-like [Melia azedarach]|uniref:WD repeat-containing protein 76-like n=1 Tax=Melia azedarach TaxID=155640 RepID=A0ACC1XFT0_MELAZ|nr:WD repeat-containing protein 76-like [Melia azedarach]
MAPEKLSEYERKRLENIKRNDEMLAALKIQSKAADLSAASKRQRVEAKSYKLSPEKKAKPEKPIVLRRSLRTQGMPPDSNGLFDEYVDSVHKTLDSKGLRDDFVNCGDRTMKSSTQNKSSAANAIGPLSFEDACVKKKSYKPLVDTILRVARKAHFGDVEEECYTSFDHEMKPKVEVSVKEEELDEVKACKDENLSENCDFGSAIKYGFDGIKTCNEEDSSVRRDLCSCGLIKGVVKAEKSERESCLDLGSLTLKPENIARIMPGRIMVVKFFPSTDVRMVVAGSKAGNITFWNLNPQEEKDNGIYLYDTHSGPVSGIAIQQSCYSKIFTSCYDGLIRLMDIEKEVFDLVYRSEYSIYALSQQPNNMNTLYFSEGQGGLSIWDVRAGKTSNEYLLHDARINTVDFNFQNPNIMATSSTEGTACLWDLRSMDADKPKPLQMVQHKRAVHSAYFSPSGSSLVTTSFDDKVGIWSGVNFEDSTVIQHNNQTGRWISSFRAIWGWDDSYIFIGNMKRGVDVISPARRKTIMTVQSPDISAIPCRFDAHPDQIGMLAGATAGGQVYVWTLDKESAGE